MRKSNKSLATSYKWIQKEGFSLIELAVGMSVFMMLLLVVTGMMMTAFKNDSQSQAYEKVQAAHLVIVNDLIQVARFSTSADTSVPGQLTIQDDVAGEITVYRVNGSDQLEKVVNGHSQGLMTSKDLTVETFSVTNKASAGEVELLLVEVKLVDNLGEMKDAKGKQFMLSVRS